MVLYLFQIQNILYLPTNIIFKTKFIFQKTIMKIECIYEHDDSY